MALERNNHNQTNIRSQFIFKMIHIYTHMYVFYMIY